MATLKVANCGSQLLLVIVCLSIVSCSNPGPAGDHQSQDAGTQARDPTEQMDSGTRPEVDGGESQDAGFDGGFPGPCAECLPQELCAATGCTRYCGLCSETQPCFDGGRCVLQFLGEGMCIYPNAPCSENGPPPNWVLLDVESILGCDGVPESNYCGRRYELNFDAGLMSFQVEWRSSSDAGTLGVKEIPMPSVVVGAWRAAGTTLWCIDDSEFVTLQCAWHAPLISLSAVAESGEVSEFSFGQFGGVQPPEVVTDTIRATQIYIEAVADAGF